MTFVKNALKMEMSQNRFLRTCFHHIFVGCEKERLGEKNNGERDRWTDRYTDPSDKWTDGQTERHICRKTDN